MIQHLFTVLCRGVSIDQNTNQVSLFELTEDFAFSAQMNAQLAQLGAVPAIFELFSSWEREDYDEGEQGRGRIQIVGPDGQELTHQDFEVDLTLHQKFRLRTKMFGFPSAGPGRYWLNVLRLEGESWTQVGRYPVRIHLPPPAAQTALVGNGRAI